MTDAIADAEKIVGCEQQTTQGFVHSFQLYYNSEFQEYDECLGNNTTYATGGYNNLTAQEICKSIFEKNKKVYCLNKIKNSPPSTVPTITEEPAVASLESDPELLKAAAAAKTQKVLTDKEDEAMKKTSIAIDILKRNAAELLTRDISNPIIKIFVERQLIKIIDEINKKMKQLKKDRAVKSKTALKDNTVLFTYPMKPIVVVDASSEIETTPPPQIEPLPTQPPTVSTSFAPPAPESAKYFVSQFSKSGGKWGALFELIGIGNDYFPDDPIMLLRISFSGSEEDSRAAILQKIKTQGIDGNPPQPDFVWPGK